MLYCVRYDMCRAQNKFFIFAIIPFFLFIAFFPVNAHALGVSPAVIELNGLANGVKVEKQVKIIRANPSKDEYISTGASGDAAPYIQFSSSVVKLPKGVTSVPISFTIAPKNLANGIYKARLYFVTTNAPGGAADNNVSIKVGIAAELSFSVTDHEIKGLEVNMIQASDAEEGTPSLFLLFAKNTGNVDVRVDSVTIELAREETPLDVTTVTIPGKDIDIAPAAAQSRLAVKYPKQLAQGRYRAHVTVYFDGKVIADTTNILLTVVPAGTFAQSAEFISFEILGDTHDKNMPVKFDGRIKNNGQAPITPRMFVEITNEQGENVGLEQSESGTLIAGDEGFASVVFTPSKNGAYHARAYVEYGVKRTESRVADFIVGKPSVLREFIVYGLIAFAVLIALALLAWLINKLMRNRTAEVINESLKPPVPPTIASIEPISMPIQTPIQTQTPIQEQINNVPVEFTPESKEISTDTTSTITKPPQINSV